MNKNKGPRKRVVLIALYDRICLSIRFLSARLKQAGHEVHLVFLKEDRAKEINWLKENNVHYQMLWKSKFWGSGYDVDKIKREEWELLCSLVEDINPHVVGVSSRSMHSFLALQAVRRLRQVVPKAVFIAGGYGPTIDPRTYLNEFDYVCIGEGDDMIVPFVEADGPRTVPNVAYLKDDDQLVWTEILRPANLDELPYHDWDTDNKYMIQDKTVSTGDSFLDARTYDVFASRGCPSGCTYCLACHWGTMLKKFGKTFPKIRLRSPESLIEELVYAKEKHGITFVRFKDDIFGLSEEWVFQFMDLYDKCVSLEFHCILDERYATERIIKRLCDSGLYLTTCGIQSGSETIRKRILNRQIDNERIVQYAHTLKKMGIKQIEYDLIGWNPFENEETLYDGLKLIRKLPKAHNTKVGQLKILPGSPLYDYYINTRPKELSENDYTFWAIIYVMVLFSKETEKIAMEMLTERKRDISKIFRMFQLCMDNHIGRSKIMMASNLGKGRRIIGTHLDLGECEEDGIAGSDWNKVIGLRTNRFLPKGSIPKWSDLCLSYEAIRG